jgi:hypothetical protein
MADKTPTSRTPAQPVEPDPLPDRLLFLRDVYKMWGDCSHMKVARARKSDPAFPKAVYLAGSRRPQFWLSKMVKYMEAQADKPPPTRRPRPPLPGHTRRADEHGTAKSAVARTYAGRSTS